jgi:SAM-dependent methyltransferase
MTTQSELLRAPMTTIDACPGCGGSRARTRGRAGRLTLMRCLACDLVYTNPQPIAEVRESYLHDLDLAHHFGEVEARKRALFARRIALLGEPSYEHARLCDVGCGDGLFLEMAAARGWEPFGIELNPPAAGAARQRGATVFDGAVEEVDGLPWGTFDAVCSWDAIEHTPTPRRFAERLAALARVDGGRVLVTTLNADSLVARTMRMRWRMIDDGHFTYWNERSLRSLHRAVGLDVKSVGFFGLGRDLVAWLDRLGPSRSRPAPATGGAPGAGRSWDSWRGVLHAETAANRVLNRTKLGVGVLVESRRS